MQTAHCNSTNNRLTDLTWLMFLIQLSLSQTHWSHFLKYEYFILLSMKFRKFVHSLKNPVQCLSLVPYSVQCSPLIRKVNQDDDEDRGPFSTYIFTMK